jgi:hypothetical protein
MDRRPPEHGGQGDSTTWRMQTVEHSGSAWHR